MGRCHNEANDGISGTFMLEQADVEAADLRRQDAVRSFIRPEADRTLGDDPGVPVLDRRVDVDCPGCCKDSRARSGPTRPAGASARPASGGGGW